MKKLIFYNQKNHFLFLLILLVLFVMPCGITILITDNYISSADKAEFVYGIKAYWVNSSSTSGQTAQSSTTYKSADNNTYSGSLGKVSVTMTKNSGDDIELNGSDEFNFPGDSSATVSAKLDRGLYFGNPTTYVKVSVTITPTSGFRVTSLQTYQNSKDPDRSFKYPSFTSTRYISSSLGFYSSEKSYTPESSRKLKLGYAITLRDDENTSAYNYDYVVFAPINYIIYFYENGGDWSGTSLSYKTTSTLFYDDYNIVSGNPTKTGYTFDGWYTSGGSKVTSSTAFTNNSNTSLYAHWKANTYKIKYDLDGGSKVGSYWPTTATYGTAFNVSNPERTGYTFSGWTASGINTSTAKYGSTKSLATNSWTNGSTLVYYGAYIGFNNLTPTNNGTVTLKANWEANGYTLTANSNGGLFSTSVPIGNTIGYEWRRSSDRITATRTILFDRTYETYVDENGITQTIALPTPTRTGYSFYGWWTSSSGGTEIFSSNNNIMNSTSGKTIYAHWTPNIYTITLDNQSGSGGTSKFYLKYNTSWCSDEDGTTTITSITKPTRTGYTFGGYYTGTGGSGTQIINSLGSIVGSKTYITENDILYAYWTANTYSIKFDANGGSGSMSNQSMVYDKESNLSTNKYSRQGYYFVGWSTKKEGVQSAIPAYGQINDYIRYKDETKVNNLATSGTVTLYAIWLDTWANHGTVPNGTGASTDPYIIDSAEDLAWMINNHGNVLRYFKQTKSLDLSGYYWYSIGTSKEQTGTTVDKAFKGVYNGQGYKINNLKVPQITNVSGNNIQSNIGLFGYTVGAEITGIYLTNAIIYGKENVGLLVSNASQTKINSNIIENSSIYASGNFGAIAGKIASGEIKYNLVYITSSGGTSTSGLYTGSTTLATNLIENNGTRSSVGTQDFSGWGMVNNRLLPTNISWHAKILTTTSSDINNWINKALS